MALERTVKKKPTRTHQNISLFCSGTGLVTVPRASMDQAKLKSGLKLKDTQRPLINHPVGYAK